MIYYEFFFHQWDLYFHPDTKKGFLVNKFRNQARSNNNYLIDLNESIGQEDLSDEQKEEYANFFRDCVVAKQKTDIKQKLRESARWRRAMMTHFEDDFSRICNFYFAMPELVGPDFINSLRHQYDRLFAYRFCLTLEFYSHPLIKMLLRKNGKIWYRSFIQCSKLRFRATSHRLKTPICSILLVC